MDGFSPEDILPGPLTDTLKEELKHWVVSSVVKEKNGSKVTIHLIKKEES